ncbi:septum site-determining protein Ssd [Hamadaea tsunoensis]|uniref:septum site-determining protein Ssd n=1 Tax=Hamadaea tsunoensis TaxID=53368 RepID=UPI001B7F7FFC|nr:septum site-determining protein Ssd [Hamadaea tsunoensis]
MSADAAVTEEVLRIAAVSGQAVEIAIDPGAVGPRYGVAPLVLVGADLLDEVRRQLPPRRAGVLVVGAGADGAVLLPAAQDLGAEHVAMLPAAREWLLNRLAEARTGPRREGRIVGVVGGRGGSGASTLAAALAVTGVRAGLSTLLVDADPLGGGLDLALGWERERGLRWSGLAGASGRVDPGTLTAALPGRGPLAVLAWDRPSVVPAAAGAEAMTAALDAGRRAADLVIVDLPRSFDAAASAAARSALMILLVLPSEVRATAAATQVVREVERHCRRIGVVVRGPSPGGLRPGEVARAVGLPLVGEMRPEPGLAAALEKGVVPAATGRGPLAHLCRDLLRSVLA